jgi:hypothetical protein
MKVNITVTWLGVALVLGAVILLTIQGISVLDIIFKKDSVEPFANPYFEDLQLTSCPADTEQYIDEGGRSVCCDGKVVGGKCGGRQVCSLSEGFGGLPTCGEWLGAYLAEKGRDRCPDSMPNYFENSKTGVKGCTSGDRVRDGTAALSRPADKQCKLYNGKDDDMIKMDSCTNQLMFERTKCFSKDINGTKKQFIDGRGQMPPTINCSVMDINAFQAGNCVEQTSFARSIDYLINKHFPQAKQWKDNSHNWPPQYKLTFCNVMQKLNFDKTIQFDDLKKISVF